MGDLNRIGNQVREARKGQGLTQAALAAEAGISRTTLSLLESGMVQELGIRKVIRILGRLGLELTTRPAGAPPTLEEIREER
ncbi:MAG: helix-turn-helix domain-containing protein [Candidatus Uhrbacteria bacterium]|nr:helix-turn-helix domain-containing protein [Candidatus Uhrbacteria bacterium]